MMSRIKRPFFSTTDDDHWPFLGLCHQLLGCFWTHPYPHLYSFLNSQWASLTPPLERGKLDLTSGLGTCLSLCQTPQWSPSCLNDWLALIFWSLLGCHLFRELFFWLLAIFYCYYYYYALFSLITLTVFTIWCISVCLPITTNHLQDRNANSQGQGFWLIHYYSFCSS